MDFFRALPFSNPSLREIFLTGGRSLDPNGKFFFFKPSFHASSKGCTFFVNYVRELVAIMTEIVATHVVATPPPVRQSTTTLTFVQMVVQLGPV